MTSPLQLGSSDLLKRVCSAVDQIAEERREELRVQRLFQTISEQRIPFMRAMDLRAERVVADEGADIDPLARELADEHELLRRSGIFALAIQRKFLGDEATFLEACELAKSEGGFLEPYSVDTMMQRLRGTAGEHPQWMIARSKGRAYSFEQTDFEESAYGGGIQVELPTPDQPNVVADLMPAPELGDSVPSTAKAQDALREIQERPSCAAVVRDIYALDQHLGFASSSRDLIYREIMAMNALRPEQERIRYVLAAIFSVRGLSLPHESPLILPDGETIDNIISLVIHAKSDKYPSELGWKLAGEKEPPAPDGTLKPRNVPVPGGEEGTWLITDWNVMVTDLVQAQKRADVKAAIARPLRSTRGRRRAGGA